MNGVYRLLQLYIYFIYKIKVIRLTFFRRITLFFSFSIFFISHSYLKKYKLLQSKKKAKKITGLFSFYF